MPRIFDNINEKLLASLQDSLEVAYRADFCAGYFNLRGWEPLGKYVDCWEGNEGSCCRLLVGMQRAPRHELEQAFAFRDGEQRIDNAEAARLRRRLANEFREQLTVGAPNNRDEKTLRMLVEQLRSKKLIVKLYLRHQLHAKLYLTYRHDRANPRTGYVGSSNLTFSGISGNGELNVDVLDQDASQKLADWFEERWEDRLCIDISNELIEIIEESWARKDLIPPYHVYIKIAYHLSYEAREGLRTFDTPQEFKNIMFPYQEAAIKIAAHHLSKRGGVIIGDVVGLGKTLMASALAKMIEDIEGTSTLIICPKNLEKMWQSYVDQYGLRAKVMPLSVVLKQIADVPARFRLVLIDESHNLRNREGKRYAAIQEYIQQSNSKVILLSATPYNKTYLDLSSQLRLFVDETADLGIRPEQYIKALGGEAEFNRKHQSPLRSLAAFEHSEQPDDWRELMRLYLIRRTRSFIKTNYAEWDEEKQRYYLHLPNGGRNYFPERAPRTFKFHLDTEDKQNQYAQLYADDVVETINKLNLPRYGLGNFIAKDPKNPANPDEAKQLENLGKAGKRLMGFSRTNLFKRLESSGYAFLQSVERHILRNYVFIHALKNGLPLPIGTQDSVMLDTRFVDSDVDIAASLFDDDHSDDDMPIDATVEQKDDFVERARMTYERYASEYRRRFKWIRPDLFEDGLVQSLEADVERLTKIFTDAGEWRTNEDAKLNALIDLITKQHPNEKILVFSQFADTVNYLERALVQRGITQVKAATGDTNDPTSIAWHFSPVSNGKRSEISALEEVRVLLATDILSEGQNLQDAHIVVNFDLPWAIIRLIQRAGRVDRIGQQHNLILCYSFLPAEGIEKIIRLRARVNNRLKENAEVMGSDEAFFEDSANSSTLYDLYSEKAGILDDDADSEVDLSSYAYQIWQNAIKDDSRLERIIKDMSPVSFATRAWQEKPNRPSGVLVYMQTAQDNDALAWINEHGDSVTESQYAILQAAQCKPDALPLSRKDNHHELVKRGVEVILSENRSVGGQLGRPSGARYRTYSRLRDYQHEKRGTLFDVSDHELEQAIEELYRYPLYPSARNTLNRHLRSGISNQELAQLVVDLRRDDKFCVIHDDEDKSGLRIICSLGLHAGENL